MNNGEEELIKNVLFRKSSYVICIIYCLVVTKYFVGEFYFEFHEICNEL